MVKPLPLPLRQATASFRLNLQCWLCPAGRNLFLSIRLPSAEEPAGRPWLMPIGTPSNAMAASMSSWRRSSNRSRKTRPRTAAKGSTISASGGQGRGVAWVATLQRGGGARRWRTRWRTLLTTTTLLSQRASPSLLWSGPCLESLIGSGLARIPRVGCDNRGGAAAGVSPPCPVRRTWRGRKWRERPPYFGR